MINALIGIKVNQSQKFLENGTRIPVTEVLVNGNYIIAHKTFPKDGYTAVQLGFGTKKHPTKALLGHIKGAKLQNAPRFLREVSLHTDSSDMPEIGTFVVPSDVLKVGDIVDVMGVSKGKGYAGGVKRYHFRGGPRTHGQSDRERAPGSIGQTTTPGRVYKGKKMAGRMGHETVTVKNLEVVAVDEKGILINGLVPGGRNTLITIKKVGEQKNFVGLIKETVKAEVVEAPVEETSAQEEAAVVETAENPEPEPTKEEENGK